MPRVSVVVPAYNAAGHIERALNSVLVQTMPELEVIVVDDASSDATLDIAYGAASCDPRVRVLHSERNGGVSASRNRGINAAQGEWIALLDADDAWSAERLEQMLPAAETADVISDDVCIVFEKASKGFSQSLIQRRGLALAAPRRITLIDFVRYDLGLLKPIIRRSFLNRHQLAYNPAYRYAEDFLFYFELLSLGARWLQLPQAYYQYYKYAGSQTTSNLQSQYGKLVLWQSVIESSRTLLDHPAAVRDAELAAALRSRMKKARGHVALAAFWESLRQRRFVELVRLLYEQPTMALLIMGYVVNRAYLRVLWRIRRLRDSGHSGCSPHKGAQTTQR